MLDNYIRREVKEIIFYLFIGLLACIVIPLIAGLSWGGFEESFVSGVINISDYLGTYLVYVYFVIGAFLLIIFPIASLLIIKEGEYPATQPNPTWFRVFTVSYIFNPEHGALWKLSEALGFSGNKNLMKWSGRILRVFILAIILFGALGVAQVLNPKLNVVGVPSGAGVEQQITLISDVAFGSGIPSFSENGTLMIVLFFLLGLDAYICARFIKDKKLALLVFFMVAFLVISPILGLVWMSIHSIVYGNSEASLFATFLFGLLGSWMTILTGVFLFWFVWHFMNNLFIKLSEVATTNADIIFISVIVLSVLLVLWVTTEVYLYRFRQRRSARAIESQV